MISRRPFLVAILLAFTLGTVTPAFAGEHTPVLQQSSHRSAHSHSVRRYEHLLEGVWASVDTSQGAAEGAMNLRSDGRVVLAIAPVGSVVVAPLTGVWRADARVIEIVIPQRGTAVLRYRLTRKGLDVEYANGIRQHFYRYVKSNRKVSGAHA